VGLKFLLARYFDGFDPYNFQTFLQDMALELFGIFLINYNLVMPIGPKVQSAYYCDK
jgi:hypothetical protein